MAPSTTSKPVPAVNSPLDTSHLSDYARLKPSCMATTRNPKRESERIRSFRRWPVKFLNPKDLAKNGFYYTKELDIVKCAFCGVEIGYWEKGDDPRSDHVKWAPDCDFVNGKDCGNVPLEECGPEEEQEEEEEESLTSYDTCGPFHNEIRPFSGPERVPLDTSALWRNLEHLGVSKTRGPAMPRYSTYESRLKTFERWPADHGLRPEALAEAGFYYLQYHDKTMCFHCGGGLKNWEADDDPWVEHARWFDKCGFVNIQKGKDFVNEVLAKKKAVLPAKAVLDLCNCSTSSSEPGENAKAETSASEEKVSPTCTSSSSSSNTKEIELCRICYTRERAIVFLPCGHFFSCTQCAPSLTNCAVCRKPCEAIVRAYLS
ncbi:UNVERIFIED_CONTAM: hypothetical protein PYX00_003299 [Menopon gallinae]